MLYFEWDTWKAAKNFRDHKVSFGAARAELEDPHAIEEEDQVIEGEVRLRTTGMAEGEVIVLVTHTNRDGENEGDEIARIISARKASLGERRQYDELRTSSSRNTSDQ